MSLRVIIMGVSGCGKSSVGEGLAKALAVPYRDGDDLHPDTNVEKMRAGIALTDEDRWPWLDRVAQALNAEAPIIIGCSALRRVYRDRIRAGAGGPVCFVHLAGSRDLIAARMAERAGHYMPLSLLDSQFATLEAPGPDEAVTVDIDQPLERIVAAVLPQIQGAKT
ncbi:gluconokinase [Rhodobacter sp. TJ_12]|uniref:gluconokinase n=1 Tax=Rhodobacter sp. TJ_12 TaxID=2029399 RepID=UPI001CBF6E95|nr:gluconokinase [Rhodobacter sp. TJ_12]MBZ4021015.1 gluconokinase [Rhodobacter sp. TJ_12]